MDIFVHLYMDIFVHYFYILQIMNYLNKSCLCCNMKQSVNQVIKKKNGKIVDYNETIINKEVHVSSFKITGMNEETVKNFGALMHLL